MAVKKSCPECGAAWEQGETCQDYFHQMLFWENEHPEYGEVHHLMVLCYYLQHPSLYSPEGLAYGKQLLADFLERGLSPQEVRQRRRGQVDSGKREWKVKGKPGARGSYPRPIQWAMTAKDVVAGGADQYCENVCKWARSILDLLR
jgi:hypothetical protein